MQMGAQYCSSIIGSVWTGHSIDLSHLCTGIQAVYNVLPLFLLSSSFVTILYLGMVLKLYIVSISMFKCGCKVILEECFLHG